MFKEKVFSSMVAYAVVESSTTRLGVHAPVEAYSNHFAYNAMLCSYVFQAIRLT